MKKQFTRSEFYDLVWSKPLTHLAKDFGVPDVALHKVCRKHDIPKPPVGWWAKLAAGKKVSRPPLPKLKAGMSDTVSISGSALRNEPESIAKSREEALSRTSKFDPRSDVKENPLVSRSMAKLRKAKPTDQGVVHLAKSGLIDIGIAPSSIDRIELALNRIVAAAQVQGFDLAKDENRVVFTDGKISVPFRLKETVSRTKHEPTGKELAKEDEERKRRERTWMRNGWGAAPTSGLFRQWPEWDYAPSGKVTFEFDLFVRQSSSIRRSFKDAKIQRLENMANDIAIGLATIAAAKAEDNRNDEERKVREKEAADRRNKQKRIAYIEDRRMQLIPKLLDRIEKRDQLRQLATHTAEILGDSHSPRSEQFADWLAEKLASAECAASADGLEELLAGEDLFGENDDKGFYPSRDGW